MRVRFEGRRGRGDDTALNGIHIYCRNYEDWSDGVEITIHDGYWGDWRPWKGEERNYYITGSRVRFEGA